MDLVPILRGKNVEKILLLNKEATYMKKNIITIIICFLTIGYPAFASHHGDGHDHINDETPNIITNDNEYLTNINLMKGHLWVGIELYTI